MENLINTNLNVNVKNKLANAANSNRTMMFGIGMIVVVAIVVVLLVVVFRTRAVNQAMNPILIDQPINAYDVAENSQQFDVQPSDRGLEYTYSCWFYVQDWYYRFNDWKAIYVKGPTSGDPVAVGGMNPGVYLYPETNNLLVSIATYNNPKEQVSVSNIPLQKWVHLTVVLNNRTVDVYVNGKLERSKVLAGVPKLNADKVSVAPNQGFFGKISRLQYFARSLKPDEVYSVYQNGPY
jgi:hypothetical protein